ncbi:hypothetical protein OIU84_022054 [Salix udensis]|uniref:Uncharacterized protein n=1 Tax=Salix udensis TaxID=889485 RepID=A0AAD6KMV2_9ROSI|nr:hypothetical protein OIU84_022054 [Salix udensis]
MRDEGDEGRLREERDDPQRETMRETRAPWRRLRRGRRGHRGRRGRRRRRGRGERGRFR